MSDAEAERNRERCFRMCPKARNFHLLILWLAATPCTTPSVTWRKLLFIFCVVGILMYICKVLSLRSSTQRMPHYFGLVSLHLITEK